MKAKSLLCPNFSQAKLFLGTDFNEHGRLGFSVSFPGLKALSGEGPCIKSLGFGRFFGKRTYAKVKVDTEGRGQLFAQFRADERLSLGFGVSTNLKAAPGCCLTERVDLGLSVAFNK